MQVQQPNLPVLAHQAFAPKLAHKNITPRVPLSEKISYNIKELLHKKADIDIGDLLVAVPALKRELIKAAIREKTSNSNSKLPLTFFEDDGVDTTAIYTDFFINDVKIKSMLDTGSAKTCMSSEVAAKLGLSIDAASTSVFTLDKGTKQSSPLSIIYDVPLSLGGKLIIPGAVKVLPVCPANLIIGNNWTKKRAKAKLNLEERVIKDNEATQQVAIEGSKGDSDASAETEEDESDEDNDNDSDKLEKMLMMLEDKFQEQKSEFGQIYMKEDPLNPGMYIILSAKKRRFYVPPFTTRHYELKLSPSLVKDVKYEDYHVMCDITNPKLNDLPSIIWQPSSSYISQEKGSMVYTSFWSTTPLSLSSLCLMMNL